MQTMRALVYDGRSAELREVPVPEPPSERYALMKVLACGICRTDVHIVKGELTPERLPIIPGHQVVGRLVGDPSGKLYGISWMYDTCGECFYCRTGRENLCERARFTGYSVDGGLAEYMVVPRDFTFPLPDRPPESLAPLMCAGIIGYRTVRLGVRDEDENVALWGFGASAHIVIQLLKHMGRRVLAFSRNRRNLELAEELGADWIGTYDERPPIRVDSSLTFAPSTEVVARAVELTRRGGRIAVNAIHLDEGFRVPFGAIYGEKQVIVVTNYTRRDAEEFLRLAVEIPVRTSYQVLGLDEVLEGFKAMEERRARGSIVIKIN